MGNRKSTFAQNRRFVDVAIALPVIGAILVLMPLLWPQGDVSEAEPVRTSNALIYLFSIWIAMIAAAAFLARVIRRADAPDA